jgi:hypothetical protein
MTHEDRVFVVNVVVIDFTHETMVINVISQPTSVVAKLSAIAKIYKYRRFHERHHFLSMAMEVHKSPGRIWIVSLRSLFVFSMIDN